MPILKSNVLVRTNIKAFLNVKVSASLGNFFQIFSFRLKILAKREKFESILTDLQNRDFDLTLKGRNFSSLVCLSSFAFNQLNGPRSQGLVVRAVFCGIIGTGFNSSPFQKFFSTWPLLDGWKILKPAKLN